MINYMKSEFYRIRHTGVLYWTITILMALSILFQFVNYLFATIYATTSFSYSTLVANPMTFPYMGVVIASILYDSSRKNGNLKNTIASGISRKNILIAKCIVSTISSIIAMICTLLVWIVSTEVLLKKTGPVKLEDLLFEIPAIFLLAVSCVISILVILELINSSVIASIIWACLWIFIPKILMILGMRYLVVHKISLWIPSNLFHMVNGEHVNLHECITAWDTMEGMLRCIIPGGVGIVVFLFIGIALVRKKDF